MKRVWATIRHDMRFQYKNGFYLVSLLILPVLYALTRLVRDTGAVPLEPFFAMLCVVNLITTTFFFMAGLFLLEQDEGVIQALVVTPLRGTDYLMSKAVTLSGLAAVETGLLVLLVYPGPINPAVLFGGLFVTGLLFVFLGFLAVARHRAINTFLPRAIGWTAVFFLPIIGLFGLRDAPLFLIHPITPAFSTLELAFYPDSPSKAWSPVLPPWSGPVLLALWSIGSFLWARSVFNRVVRPAAI